MKSRIVCYRLEGKPGPRTLTMPVGSEVLAAGYHQGAVGLWVRLVDATETSDMLSHIFELFETGGTVEGPMHYLGTCAAPGGTFCLHVAERIPRQAEPVMVFEQRLTAVEDNLEEIADSLRVRLEALEGSGTREPAESMPLDLLARVETLDKLRVRLGEEVGRLRDRIQTLEQAPRVLATVVDPETKEPAS